MRVLLSGVYKLPPSARRPGLLKKACILGMGRKGKGNGEVTVNFLDNKALRRLNKRFLGHDRNTDVIAFDYDPVPGVPWSQQDSLGDIYVSADQARAQARSMGHSVLRETLTLVLHGSLHLVGFRDSSPRPKAKMFSRQETLLQRLLPRAV